MVVFLNVMFFFRLRCLHILNNHICIHRTFVDSSFFNPIHIRGHNSLNGVCWGFVDVGRCRLAMLLMLLKATTLETVPTKKLSMMTTSMLAMSMMTIPTMAMLLLPMPAMWPSLAMVLTAPMVWAVLCCDR
jgi:hypothetical protein